MKEYKIISDQNSNCQKLLNTWRHEFNVNVLQMTSDSEGTVTILLTRTKKDNEKQ